MANNWFPHDSTAHNDQSILLLRMKYGWEGYGIFWAILEAMYETADAKLDANALPTLCLRFSIPEDKLMAVVNYCTEISLFISQDGELYSVRLVEEKAKALERSKMAKESADRRWKKKSMKPRNANAMPSLSVGNAPPHPTPPIQPSSASLKNETKSERTDSDNEVILCRAVEAEGWCDRAYLDKTLNQLRSLSKENRDEAYRKLRVLANTYLGKGERVKTLSKKIFHEIAGFVNDRGQMEKVLTEKEIASRRAFAEEEYGRTYVEEEL